jgi:hypothetical protein
MSKRISSAPPFDTVNRVCTALGARLVAQAVHSWSVFHKPALYQGMTSVVPKSAE